MYKTRNKNGAKLPKEQLKETYEKESKVLFLFEQGRIFFVCIDIFQKIGYNIRGLSG